MTGHKDHSLASSYVGSSQRDVVTIVHGFELGDVVDYSVPHIGSCARRISLSYAIRVLPDPTAMALLSTQNANLPACTRSFASGSSGTEKHTSSPHVLVEGVNGSAAYIAFAVEG